MIGTWTYRLMRWTLGGVFIYAGGTKLAAPTELAVLIDAFGLVPEMLIMPAAHLLPIQEVAGGIGLLFDIEGSLSIIAGLLVLFIGVLSYGVWIGLDVDCGCFGPGDPEAEAFHGLRASLYRDIGMLAVVLIIFGWRAIWNIHPVPLHRKTAQWFSRKELKDVCS